MSASATRFPVIQRAQAQGGAAAIAGGGGGGGNGGGGGGGGGAPLPPAAAAAAAAVQGNSGRDVGALWDTFAEYAKAQAKQVISAFTRHGYTLATAKPEIRTAIDTLNLDLPAHGSRGPGHPVHPAFKEAAARWVVALTAWAEAHPVGPRVIVPGQRHSPEQEAAHREQKQEKREARAQDKAAAAKAKCQAAGNHNSARKGRCSNCGQK